MLKFLAFIIQKSVKLKMVHCLFLEFAVYHLFMCNVYFPSRTTLLEQLKL
jgi:hypothetical protein